MILTFICFALIGVLCQTTESRPDYCTMLPDGGPCEAYMPSYYFDVSSNSCKQFVFGGCLGNPNRFSNEALCLQTCQ
ncbi:PI-actitoxin-Afv2b [Biomphalaria glabrata]|nr:PI-actitoxin-Afv2b [Biomphalaria glabrata]